MDNEKNLVPGGEQLDTETRSVVSTPSELPGVPATKSGVTTAAADASPTSAPIKPGDTEVKAGGLGRPNAPTSPVRARVARRKRSNPWGWVFIVLVGLAAGVGAFFWVRGNQTVTTFQGLTTTASYRQAISLSVSATGSISANADVALTFGSAGNVTNVSVKPGDTVKKGQELARVDDTDLQSSVKTAKASLDQAQANFKKATDGASQKDIDIAKASLNSAQAKYQQTKNGNALPTDISSAQAQLRSAQAKLALDQQGGTPADIAAAKSAQSSAEASLASAQAKLAKDQAGPDNGTITQAQATYDQALASYDKTKSQLQTAIVSAQTTRDQALNSLRNAQDKYNAVYSNNHNGDGSLKDGLKQADIDSETAAYRNLQDVQGTYNKSDVSLNDARVQLDTGVRTAQSQVDNAKAQLDKTKAGPTPADIAADQASVASAQSQVDNAKKSLTALTPTDAQIAADQASVASAQASLAKLNGGTATDVASAQSSVDQANATLNDLLAGPKPNDIAVSQAQVNQAQANYDNTVAKLKNAIITAPFDGVVLPPAATNTNSSPTIPVIGQAITASTTMFQLVDTSSLRVDVSVGESDIAKVKLGQAVALNLDAVSGRSFTGKITFISSKSTVSNNVVNYLVTVTLDQPNQNTFNDVWGQELAKYFAALRPAGTNANQGQAQGGQNRQGGNNAGGAGAGAGVAGGLPGGAAAGAGNQVRIPAAFASQLGACGYIPSFGPADSSEQPKVGMSANATICQTLKGGVLSVANRAIKTKTENGRRIQYVQVLVDKETGKIEDRPITTGLVGDANTEITGGNLTDTDQIVLSTTPTNRASGAAANQFPIPAGGPGGGRGN